MADYNQNSPSAPPIPDPTDNIDKFLADLDLEERSRPQWIGLPSGAVVKVTQPDIDSLRSSMTETANERAAEDAQSLNEILFFSRLYVDFVVVCNDEVFQVHKCMVLPRCELFNEAAKDGITTERGLTTVIMNEHEPATLKHLLYFLYTSTIRFDAFGNRDDKEAVCHKLLLIAGDYKMKQLEDTVWPILKICFE